MRNGWKNFVLRDSYTLNHVDESVDGGRYLEKIFPQLGIRFIAVNDAYDSLTGDPQSDSFVIPFKNLINDSYCKDISMKIRSSLEVKQKNGEFVGAFAPYGYKKSPENKNRLVVDEAVSEYVQMIFCLLYTSEERSEPPPAIRERKYHYTQLLHHGEQPHHTVV